MPMRILTLVQHAKHEDPEARSCVVYDMAFDRKAKDSFREVGTLMSQQWPFSELKHASFQRLQVFLRLRHAPPFDCVVGDRLQICLRALRKLEASHLSYLSLLRNAAKALRPSTVRPAATSSSPSWISARNLASLSSSSSL